MIVQIGYWGSFFLSAFGAFATVLSLYVWKNAAITDRDHPEVVKNRLISFIAATVVCPLTLLVFDVDTGGGPSLLRWAGWSADGAVSAIVLPLLLSMLLFLGPMFLYFRSNSPADFLQQAKEELDSKTLISMRTYLVAPLCEEAVYRVFVCTVLVAGGWSFYYAGLMSPVMFGAAHLHHLIGLVNSRGYSLQQGILVVGFQLFYTTVFGAYASFLFLRTGHLFACFIPHAYCNMMGFPDFGWAVDPKHPHYQERTLVGGVFVLGVVLFYLCLYPLTEPSIYSSFVWYEIPRLTNFTSNN